MSSKTVNTIIDDADGQTQYSSGWELAGSGNEYNHTTSATRIQGATFTLKFVGTSIKVYGTLTEHQEDNLGTFPNTTYSLDGDTPLRFSGIPSGTTQYQQLFYQSPPLPNLEHTLVGTCADEGSMVWLDYFVVEMTIDSGPPTSPIASLPLTHTVTSIVTATSAPVVSASRAPSSPIGAIVGGIIGGFALLLLMLAFFLWYRRYQHDASEDVSEDAGANMYDMRGHPFQVLQSSSPRATPSQGVLSARSPQNQLSGIHEASVDNNDYAFGRSRATEPQQLGQGRHHALRQLPVPPSGSNRPNEASGAGAVTSRRSRESTSTLPAYSHRHGS